jgi:hypothetical protein
LVSSSFSSSEIHSSSRLSYGERRLFTVGKVPPSSSVLVCDVDEDDGFKKGTSGCDVSAPISSLFLSEVIEEKVVDDNECWSENCKGVLADESVAGRIVSEWTPSSGSAFVVDEDDLGRRDGPASIFSFSSRERTWDRESRAENCEVGLADELFTGEADPLPPAFFPWSDFFVDDEDVLSFFGRDDSAPISSCVEGSLVEGAGVKES